VSGTTTDLPLEQQSILYEQRNCRWLHGSKHHTFCCNSLCVPDVVTCSCSGKHRYHIHSQQWLRQSGIIILKTLTVSPNVTAANCEWRYTISYWCYIQVSTSNGTAGRFMEQYQYFVWQTVKCSPRISVTGSCSRNNRYLILSQQWMRQSGVII
jgi:hypothetical protein